MTATSDITGEVVFDGVLWSSNGHRQQDTITCTFQTQLIHPDDPDHTGTAHHTIIMVHRP